MSSRAVRSILGMDIGGEGVKESPGVCKLVRGLRVAERLGRQYGNEFALRTVSQIFR